MSLTVKIPTIDTANVDIDLTGLSVEAKEMLGSDEQAIALHRLEDALSGMDRASDGALELTNAAVKGATKYRKEFYQQVGVYIFSVRANLQLFDALTDTPWSVGKEIIEQAMHQTLRLQRRLLREELVRDDRWSQEIVPTIYAISERIPEEPAPNIVN